MQIKLKFVFSFNISIVCETEERASMISRNAYKVNLFLHYLHSFSSCAFTIASFPNLGGLFIQFTIDLIYIIKEMFTL